MTISLQTTGTHVSHGAREGNASVEGLYSGHRQPLRDISETLQFYSLFFCSPKEKVIEGNVANWEGEARAHQLFLFWAAFSQLLLRLSEGEAQNFFQRVVRKRV